MRIDLGILEFIQTYLRCGLLDGVMPVITKLGDGGILWICSSLLLLVFPKTRKAGAAMAVSLGLEVLCCNVLLKPLVAQSRNRLRIPALVLAALIGFSRLYLYVHYPTDVLAGVLVGIMIGWLGNMLVLSIGEKLHGKLHVSI